MKAEYELKRDWQYLGGAESKFADMLPAGTKLGSIETLDGSYMTPQQLADAVLRGLAGEVSTEDEAKQSRRRSSVKDE